MITLIGIPNCFSFRNTLKWLEAKKVEYEFIDVKKEPLTLSEIADLASMVTFDTLINRRGTTWRELKLGDIEMTNQQLLELVEKNQTLIKRPVIVDEEGVAMVGFDEDALARFIEDQNE
jgi:Spx/MgsR family transcriptional regulator